MQLLIKIIFIYIPAILFYYGVIDSLILIKNGQL